MTWNKWGPHALRREDGARSICKSEYDGVLTYILWERRTIVAVEHVGRDDMEGRRMVLERLMHG